MPTFQRGGSWMSGPARSEPAACDACSRSVAMSMARASLARRRARAERLREVTISSQVHAPRVFTSASARETGCSGVRGARDRILSPPLFDGIACATQPAEALAIGLADRRFDRLADGLSDGLADGLAGGIVDAKTSSSMGAPAGAPTGVPMGRHAFERTISRAHERATTRRDACAPRLEA